MERKKRFLNRVLSILMACMMILNVPMSVLASETGSAVPETVAVTEAATEASTESATETGTEAAVAAEEATESTETPTESTEAPTESTEALTESTEVPTESTEAPTESTEAPTEATEAPTESTEVPTESTEAPTEATEAPTEATEAPTEATEAPTEATEVPAETTEAPTEATEVPTETTEAPTEATEAPTESTEAPTESTEAPTEAPTKTTEAQTEETKVSVEIKGEVKNEAPALATANDLDTSNLNFDVENPAGYVTISFVDNGIRPEDAEIDDVELYGQAVGTIIKATEVPYVTGESVADVTVRLLEAMELEYDYTGTVEDGFYLAALEDFELNGIYYATFGEFDAGKESGWCVRVNNWHINQGTSSVEVEDEDVISWLYTCQYGADIGADFSNPSADITDVVLSDETLNLVYDEESEIYTCTVPSNTNTIAFEVKLQNYASVVTVTVDGEPVKYRPNKVINVTANSTVVISTELEYMDAENNNQTTTYTDSVTIQLINKAPVVTENALASMTVTVGKEISVELSKFFTDTEGDALSYSIKCEALNLEQTLEGSVFTGTIPTPGEYEFILTATDGIESVNHTVTLTVKENSAPNIEEAYAETKSKTYVYSSSYVYIYMDDIFEDADGDALTYKATLDGEEVEIAYNSWSKQYYIQFAEKPVIREYKIVANDGMANSEVFTAYCIGTSATITAPEDSTLIAGGTYLYYVKGSAENDTFTLDYSLDVDTNIQPTWISSNESVLSANGDGSFTVGEVTSRQQPYVGVIYGKDGWGSDLYLGTKYIYILPAMPEVADVTIALPEHADNVIATNVSNAFTGWYSNEFNYELEDPSIASIINSGTYGLSITPKALGTTAVTATFKYDESIKCTFQVTVTGRSLQIKDQPDSDDVIFEEGKTVQLEVLGAEEGETFTWTSSDETVAAVDENGLVTVKGLGQTYITAVSSLSTEEVPLKASMYLQVKEAGKVYLDDIAVSDYSYFDGFISAQSGFNSAQLTYDWNLNENRYTYNKLAFTPYFDDETLDAVLHYQVSGGEYQTMELTSGTAVGITNGLNPGENVVTIEVYPTDDAENITTYTFNIFRPYNPIKTINNMTIYPNGETALAYPTYLDNKEGTIFRIDAETGEFVTGWNGKPSTGWSSSVYTYKTFIYGSRTEGISLYPTFGYANERVMIYVDGEPLEEAVTNWKSSVIQISEDGAEIILKVCSEKNYAEQIAAGVEDPFAEPEVTYTIYVESVTPLGIDAEILSAELTGGEFYLPGFKSESYTISALIPAGQTTADLTFTVPAGIDVYKTSVSEANKLTATEQDEDGNNIYTTPIIPITGTGMYAYSTTNIILQVTDAETGDTGKAQYAFTVSQRGAKDVYPDSIVEYLCIGSQYTNAGSYGTMPERTLKNGGGTLSLGNFGGYIVYKYDTPIINNPNNPYGVDFVIYGNSFGNGAHEPGYVQVSQDGVTWYTLAGSEHYEDHNDWNYNMTYTNNNGKSAWTNSDGESGEIYNYPIASSYPYFNWTEALEQSMTVSGYRLNSSAKDAYGSAAAVLPVFGYVDVNTNGTINGTSNNPYNHPGTLAAGGDQFDLDWAVDANGTPVQLDSISYIRVATASSIYAGAIGEKSTEVTAVNRVTNTAAEAVGVTTAPSAISLNGSEITVPENGGILRVSVVDDVLNVDVTAAEGTNIYIGNTGSAARTYTAIPEKQIIRIIVQEGEMEPYICYLKLSVVEDVLNNLPSAEEATLEDKEVIEAARASYEALSEADKEKVPEEVLNKLIAAETQIAALEKAAAESEAAAEEAAKAEAEAQKAADTCTTTINALPAVDKLTLEDKAAVEAARAAYNALSEAAKAKVSADVVNKLTAAEAQIAALEKAAAETDKTPETDKAPETNQTPEPEHTHKFSEWTTVSEATVFAKEVQERTCETCKETEKQEVGEVLTPTIKVTANKIILKKGQSTTKFEVSGLANGDSVKSMKSSNKKIFKVNKKTGKITAKKVGKAKLIITLASGLTKKVTVKVQKKAVKTTKIVGLEKTLTMIKGTRVRLTPELKPFTSLQKITYTSNKKKVVSVTRKGVLKAKKAGKAKITVKSGSKKFVVTVTVKKAKKN